MLGMTLTILAGMTSTCDGAMPSTRAEVAAGRTMTANGEVSV